VSCFPDNGDSALELMRQAEAAMQRVKRTTGNSVGVFANEQKRELADRGALGLRLKQAIRNGELLAHYQPIVSGQDWRVLGFEALVRWEHPQRGLLLPGQFLQVAEELGLIVEIGNFMLDSACRQARSWIDRGVGEFFITVNVSVLQLHRPNFVEEVRAAIDRWELPGTYIELELTENVLVGNVDRVRAMMRELKSFGVKVALDDFGTGYSSLNYLRQLPIDKLKIDQSFVKDVISDVSSAGICRVIASLGHQLGMTVLAEGVETAAQVAYLLRNECDAFQGFYFSPPVPAGEAIGILLHRYVAQDTAIMARESLTLLLVDDEENILSALHRLLRRDGYRILKATGAAQAFELLATNQVQVILSDQRMPEMSGTEFLSQVKQIYPETVRMVLSGYSDLSTITEGINRGAIYKFLTKPWSDDELRVQVRDAFRIANRHNEPKPAASAGESV